LGLERFHGAADPQRALPPSASKDRLRTSTPSMAPPIKAIIQIGVVLGSVLFAASLLNMRYSSNDIEGFFLQRPVVSTSSGGFPGTVSEDHLSSTPGEPGHDHGAARGNFSAMDVVAGFGLLQQPLLPMVAGSVPFVSVLTFSNGQEYCYNNLLLNFLYQDYPHDRMEMIITESSISKSRILQQWAQGKGGLDQWAAMMGEQYVLPAIVYIWDNKEKSRPLGDLRNRAARRARGAYIVNFDNDDFYHPNYLRYVLFQMIKNTIEVVFVTPHAVAEIRPDGSTSFLPKRQSTGGHNMAMTRNATKACHFAPLRYAEEPNFRACLEKSGAPTSSTPNMTNGVFGNRFLMIKFTNPLSITMQRFFVGRQFFNRLSMGDFERIRYSQMFMYHMLHEFSRPAMYPDASLVPEFGSFTTMKGPDPWETFHYRHRNLWDTKDYPFCKGFARMPGMVFTADSQPMERFAAGKRQTFTARSAVACCELCRNKGPIPREATKQGLMPLEHYAPRDACDGWAYEHANQTCWLGGTGFSYKPETIFTLEAAVRISACPLCGKGLAPDDAVSGAS